ADRTDAGADLADFRVHRAGVDRVLGYLGPWRIAKIGFRIGGKFGTTTFGAEIIGAARMAVPVRRRVGGDRHPADRISNIACWMRVLLVFTMGGAVVRMTVQWMRAMISHGVCVHQSQMDGTNQMVGSGREAKTHPGRIDSRLPCVQPVVAL